MNFWQQLPRPFLALAPMEDVTDSAFRQAIVELGRPNVMFTEFTNVEGLDSAGYEEVARRLKYSEKERPLVAQIWGLDPEKFFKAAKIVKELKFDGVDINLGCPVKDVVKKGACSAMIDPGLWSQVEEIVMATKEGAGELPVSVKTRIGVKQIITEEWVEFLVGLKLDALTIHGRTVAEESKVPAHWDEIGKAVEIRNRHNSQTVIIGNGDVVSGFEASEKALKYGVEGVMIGRGVFENPWVFGNRVGNESERLKALVRHIEIWEETWGGDKHFGPMKKCVKMYIKSFERAGELRERLMHFNNPTQVSKEVLEILTKLG